MNYYGVDTTQLVYASGFMSGVGCCIVVMALTALILRICRR